MKILSACLMPDSCMSRLRPKKVGYQNTTLKYQFISSFFNSYFIFAMQGTSNIFQCFQVDSYLSQ